jgi:apolipoprotein N-acyltransferase
LKNIKILSNKKFIVSIINLIIGAIFLFFSNGRYSFGPAAWIAPIFLLIFIRRQKPLLGYLICSCVLGLCSQLSFWKFSSQNPANPLFYLPFALGFLLSVPYLLDRLLFMRSKGVLKTVIFPLTYVAVEFLYVSMSPFGSTGSIAYTQMGFLPLIQIVSITGIYGVTFLISWFSTVIVSIMGEKEIANIKKYVLSYGVIFLVVMCYGGIRLLLPESDSTVQVSGINAYDLRSNEVKDKWDNVINDKKSFQQLCDNILNKLIESTRKEALAGSKAVVWAEISPIQLSVDRDRYKEIISKTAKEMGIYIVTSPNILAENLTGKSLNKLEIYSPKGEIILSHIKFGGAMFDEIIEGDKKLNSVRTEYGNWGGVICWDADFPNVIRQAGVNEVDILFSPAADWKEITPLHSANAYFRGIENGMSVIRQTANGLSFVSDNKGRILSQMNHFTSSNWVIRAQIPTKGCFTLYPYISDTFAIVCIIVLLYLINFYNRVRIKSIHCNIY